MGNYSSRRHLSSIKVVDINCRVQEFTRRVRASEFMGRNPGRFVSDSRKLNVGCRIPGLAAEDELVARNLYFLLPMDLLYSVLTEEEMASLVCKASAKGSGSCTRRRIFPVLSDFCLIPSEVKKVEEVERWRFEEVGDVDVFRQRSWRPALDTIEEAKTTHFTYNDENSSYFFAKLAEKKAAFSIQAIADRHGNRQEGPNGGTKAFVEFSESLIGTNQVTKPIDASLLLPGPVISQENKDMLIGAVSRDEIRKTLFSIDSNKSPGPDGFSSGFFKTYWDVVHNDFCLAMEEYFHTCRLLNEINSTFIAFIPKSLNVTGVGDYRSISLCNVIYKTITKIMANLIKKFIGDVVGEEQGALIPGRDICDNILMAHELALRSCWDLS